MATSSTSGPSRIANAPFDQALTGFLEKLSQEDRAAFEGSTPEDLIATVERLNNDHRANSSTR